jgi:hypothetical protein
MNIAKIKGCGSKLSEKAVDTKMARRSKRRGMIRGNKYFLKSRLLKFDAEGEVDWQEHKEMMITPNV